MMRDGRPGRRAARGRPRPAAISPATGSGTGSSAKIGGVHGEPVHLRVAEGRQVDRADDDRAARSRGRRRAASGTVSSGRSRSGARSAPDDGGVVLDGDPVHGHQYLAQRRVDRPRPGVDAAGEVARPREPAPPACRAPRRAHAEVAVDDDRRRRGSSSPSRASSSPSGMSTAPGSAANSTSCGSRTSSSTGGARQPRSSASSCGELARRRSSDRMPRPRRASAGAGRRAPRRVARGSASRARPGERVEHDDAPDERLADAGEELERLGRHQRRRSRCRRVGRMPAISHVSASASGSVREQVAVVRAAPRDADLARPAQRPNPTRAGCRAATPRHRSPAKRVSIVVGAVDQDVGVRRAVRRPSPAVNVPRWARTCVSGDCGRIGIGRGIDLGAADVGGAVEDLPVQVGLVDEVVVDDRERADARGGEGGNTALPSPPAPITTACAAARRAGAARRSRAGPAGGRSAGHPGRCGHAAILAAAARSRVRGISAQNVTMRPSETVPVVASLAAASP